jgi:hypothetical protein
MQDKISNPLGEIEKLFSARLQASNGHVDVNDFGEHALYEKFLEDPEFIRQIPCLSARSLGRIPHNSLVRYRGMVQDVYDEEYFTGVYVQKQRNGDSRLVLSKYRDIVDGDGEGDAMISYFDSPDCKVMQRQTLLCVPIPGETEWVQDFCEGVGQEKALPADEAGLLSLPQGSGVRKRRDAQPEDPESIGVMVEPIARAKEGGGGGQRESPGCGKKHTKSVSFDEEARKRGSSGSSGSSSNGVRPIDHPSFYHMQDSAQGRTPCLAKVYDCEDESFRLNDMVEIVGVYSLDAGSADVLTSALAADPRRVTMGPV